MSGIDEREAFGSAKKRVNLDNDLGGVLFFKFVIFDN